MILVKSLFCSYIHIVPRPKVSDLLGAVRFLGISLIRENVIKLGDKEAMSTETLESVIKQLGSSPVEIAKNLNEFKNSALLYSSDHPRLIDQYENKWIGVYQGRVAAAATSFDAVTKEIIGKGLPLKETILRHIDRNEKTLIL